MSLLTSTNQSLKMQQPNRKDLQWCCCACNDTLIGAIKKRVMGPVFLNRFEVKPKALLWLYVNELYKLNKGLALLCNCSEKIQELLCDVKIEYFWPYGHNIGEISKRIL